MIILYSQYYNSSLVDIQEAILSSRAPPNVFSCWYKDIRNNNKKIQKITRHISNNNPHTHFLINFGASELPIIFQNCILLGNNPTSIQFSSNKLKTFNLLSSINNNVIPKFTTSKENAIQLLNEKTSNKIFCRETTTGSRGNGIIIAKNQNEIIDAPLYTLDTKHKLEFRLHIFNNKPIFFQKKFQKHKPPIQTLESFKIKNHKNGWIYLSIQLSQIPDAINDLMPTIISFMEQTQLLFAAFDLGLNLSKNQAYILETNTNPGLSPKSSHAYATNILNYMYGSHR